MRVEWVVIKAAFKPIVFSPNGALLMRVKSAREYERLIIRRNRALRINT